jgi:hypothetical protein
MTQNLYYSVPRRLRFLDDRRYDRILHAFCINPIFMGASLPHQVGYTIDLHDSTKMGTSQGAERGLGGRIFAEVVEVRQVCRRGQCQCLTHRMAAVRSTSVGQMLRYG